MKWVMQVSVERSVEKGSIESIIRALNDASVRYLIAGGLAVIAHGYVRLTLEDLILDLREENLRRAVTALEGLGYTARAPVPFEQFVDRANRARWIAEKGLTVFSLFSARHPKTEVDLFVEAPFDFDRAYTAAERQEVAPGLVATFVSFDDLLFLKRKADRPQDREDIRRLRMVREEPRHE